ncbi:X-ray repair cross complementing protein spindle B [Rhodnius prolixus]|uniref:Putative dna repair protein rhp57 n=1 Tax=Rhodnius prolixus TaxID=13249 RepID=R4FND4_RHOPR
MDIINLSLLDKRLQCELEKAGNLSCRKLIEMDKIEFQKSGNFSLKDIEMIKTVAASILLPYGFRTAKESEEIFKDKWRKITLGCSYLDDILAGGVPVRGITELSGESGVGKTQICLQLSMTVQYPIEFGGLNASAIYICTEDRFPSVRLQQMLTKFTQESTALNNALEDHNFSDNILIDHVADFEGIQNCLFKRLPAYIANSRNKIGLIVIDSIAAIFRSEYTMKEFIHRANDMRTIGMQLHKLADKYNIAIVCVNQVTDACDNGVTVPALGLAWANLVTTKLHLSVDQDKVRNLQVLHAPHLAPAAAKFVIVESGISSVNLND